MDFSSCATLHKPSGQWLFTVDVSTHNHPDSTNSWANIENRHLTPSQFPKIENLSKAGLKPSDIPRVVERM
ncbi:uncharacterized protein VP01_2663g3 [Puccinia sorghi]|uniref:Uncharacterized protein n=1 Tax=Puccinia sorghi TaxID=27349 RepID=A0A0L6V3Y9_9BASI|nr:uncharacterized protein VP01_2663g3 [Puccinia sorghi]